MDKAELIGLTLDRLLEHFKNSPESFEYDDSQRNVNGTINPIILWKPRIQMDPYAPAVIDPHNNHAVIVVYHEILGQMQCHLLFNAPSDLKTTSNYKPDCSIITQRWFEKWRSNYRKFCRLRELIISRDLYKENRGYLRKLNSIFPDTLDDHFLGK